MNALTDLPLPRPLAQGWIDALLFAAFLLHLVFVLLLLGTAILGFAQHLREETRDHPDRGWVARLLGPFLPFEALAVVLGVAPLLLVQVGYTVSFFTAVNILAPYWVLLVAFMIVAFLSFDVLEHRVERPSRWNAVFGVVGLTALLAIPGVFVAILVLAEHPGSWTEVLRSGHHLAGRLSVLWLFRYGHVIGASVVVAATFHLAWSTPDDARRSSLARWLYGGITAQIVLGVALYALVFDRSELVTHALVSIGIVAVLVATALLVWRWLDRAVLGRALPVAMLGVVLVMLLVRDTLQRGSFTAVAREGNEAAAAYALALAPGRERALAEFEAAAGDLFSDGGAIYDRSCAFCHGREGDGRGAEGGQLTVRPEPVRELRVDRRELYRILAAGVPGSAMPAFTFFERSKLESLMTAMDRRWRVLAAPERVDPARVGDGEAEANLLWAETCVACHGADGRPTPFGARLRPAPPDLSAYSPTAALAYAVITNGYPGTMMVSFASVPEQVRWGLAALAISMRDPSP